MNNTAITTGKSAWNLLTPVHLSPNPLNYSLFLDLTASNQTSNVQKSPTILIFARINDVNIPRELLEKRRIFSDIFDFLSEFIITLLNVSDDNLLIVA